MEGFLKQLKIEQPYYPAIPLLGIFLEKIIIKKIHAPQYSLQHYIYYNNQNMEETYMSINRGMDKKDVVTYITHTNRVLEKLM